MTANTAHFYPFLPARENDVEERRTGAALRATFWATVSVLALVCALSFTHDHAAPAEAQPVSEAYGWPI